jgi:four helix bundle protein
MANILYEKSYDLTLELIDIAEEMELKNKKYISNQLYKSCTSITANIGESVHSESTKDFIHKLKISAKEANETHYWLSIIKDKNFYKIDESTWDKLNHVQRMLTKSISTSYKNLNNRKQT